MVIPRSLFAPTIVRLRVTPDEPVEGPPAVTEQRPRGSRRPHTDMAVAKVKHLIEHTGLSYSEITARTGVGRASISRWARDGAWQRPAHAPRATNMVPASRAGRRLKLRKLGIRLEAMANRHVCELEQAPRIEVEQVMQALQVLKMARLQAMGRRGRRHRATDRVTSGAWRQARDNAVNTALKEMRRGGVDLDRAPKEAVDMLIEANEPAEEHPALRERRSRRRW